MLDPLLISTVVLLLVVATNAQKVEDDVKDKVVYVINDTIIEGSRNHIAGKEIHVFRGVPYAKAPIGNRRFKAPQPIDLNEIKILDATNGYADCMQPPAFPFGRSMSEDCLYATIWVPAKVKEEYEKSGKKVGVLMVFHGGGFIIGSAQTLIHNGAVLSSRENIIVISVNYRLGVFGFLDFNRNDAPGNMGLMDQQMAMDWVNRYIHHFGGDPNNLALAGVSAGSVSISAHILNNKSRKLFNAALMDSGTIFSQSFNEHQSQSLVRGMEIARFLNCSQTDLKQILECMKKYSSKDVLSAQVHVTRNKIVGFRPTYGSKFLPQHPKKLVENIREKLPIMFVGTAKDEGSLFLETTSPGLHIIPTNGFGTTIETNNKLNFYKNVYNLKPKSTGVIEYARKHRNGAIDFLTEGLFVCQVLNFADEMSLLGAQVYVYRFDYYPQYPLMGSREKHAHHGVAFVFEMGVPLALSGAIDASPEDDAMAADMTALVGTIIKEKKPQFRKVILKRYTPVKRNVYIFQSDTKMTTQVGHPSDNKCIKAWNYAPPKPIVLCKTFIQCLSKYLP